MDKCCKVSVPMADHKGNTLRNLVNMVYSKQSLIKKSLGLDADIISDDFCHALNNANTATLENFKSALCMWSDIFIVGEMTNANIKRLTSKVFFNFTFCSGRANVYTTKTER